MVSSINGNGKVINIPWEAYELTALIETIEQATNAPMIVKGNINTLAIEIFTNLDIDFSKPNSIGKWLEFFPGIYSGGQTHKSELPVLIFETTDVHINCSIKTGAYLNA